MKDPFEEASADVDQRGALFMLLAAVAAMVVGSILNARVRDILLIIAGIIVMVMLHEAGHYFMAKRAGMKATEFFVGFGPRIWSFRRGETEFGIKAILLGGYVRILGMSNVENPVQDPDTGEWRHGFRPEDEPRTFRRGSYKNRLVVVLAGVTVNILLAFVLFYVVVAGQGQVNEGPSTTISYVVKNSAAADAGLEKGDRIVAVDGTRISGWEDLVAEIESRGGEETSFTIVRDGERLELAAVPKSRNGEGFLGVSPGSRLRSVNALQAVPETFDFMGQVITGTGESLARVFSPSGVERIGTQIVSGTGDETAREATERPRGLVGIVDYGSGIIDGNMWMLLALLGNISLALALFNLLPLLPFDGGHAVIVVYEWAASKIRRRTVTVDYQKLMPITAVVLMIFFTFALSIMFLDIREVIGN